MSESSDNRLIKDIPSDWKAIKLKRVVKIVTGNTPPKSQENNYADEGVPWVKPDNLISDFVISNPKEKISEKGMKTARLIPEKSALVCCIGSVGKVSTNTECCTTNQQINSIVFDQPDLLDSEFGLYVTLAAKEEYIKHSNKVVVSILNKTDQGSIKIPKPPLSKQRIIANFLKHKTISIDTLITDKEKLIKLLEEKRQVIITEAVTKGLDPDVKMKDSDVEWIGEIPEHWGVKKLRYLGHLQNGISKSAEHFGHGSSFVSYGDVYNNFELPLTINGLVDSTHLEKKAYSVKSGDVFFTRTSETVEEIGLASTSLKSIEDATFAGFLIRFRPSTKELVHRFSKFYFRNRLSRKYFVKEINIVTRASLGQNLLKNYPVILPPVTEQKRIANYLEYMNDQTDNLISENRQFIEKLKEYRQSLIYEAVTGKIDVQEMVKETEQEEVSSS